MKKLLWLACGGLGGLRAAAVWALLVLVWAPVQAAGPSQNSLAGSAVAKPSGAKPPSAYTVEAVPAWVSDWPDAELQSLPVASSPLQVILFDHQVRLDGKQGEEHYRRIIRRVQEPAGLEQAAQWELEFDPGYQRLVLHRLIVWRGQQKLDRLRSAKWNILQRETQLERQMVDGRLTASLVLEDIRVGDRVELAYSLRGANPVFAGHFVDQDWSLSYRGPMALMRYRLLSPQARVIHHQIDPQRHEVTEQVNKGWRELQVRRRNVAAFVADADQPVTELLPDMLQFSEFESWAEVGRWTEQLFGGPADTPELQAQAKALAAENPEASVAAVLDFVQKEIRYFGTEIGPNTHLPVAPAVTLRQRFGDCKDKVALMAALLRHLGIASTPLLVSTQWRGDALTLLPGPLAFNHAIIRVALPGGSLVLDPTRNQQTGPLAERQSIGLGKALPALADATEFALPSAAGVLRQDVQDTLNFHALSEAPELLSSWTYHGEHAEAARLLTAGERRAEVHKQFNSDYARQYPGAEPVGEMTVEEVPGHNAVRLQLRYRLSTNYLRLVEDRQLVGELGLVGLYSVLRLPDQAPRTRGLRLGPLGLYRHQVSVNYPEDVFAAQPAPQRREEGDRFITLRQSTQLSPRRADLRGEVEVREQDVPAAAWAAHRDALIKLWPRLGMTLGIGLLSPQAVEQQLKPQLSQLDDDLKRGRVRLKTQVQVKASTQLIVFNALLGSSRLPPAARGRLLLRKAVQLDHLGRPQDALPSLNEAQALLPEDTEVLTAAAVNAGLRRDDAGVIALADRGLRLQPGDVSLLMARARALYQARRFEEAQADLQQALNRAQADEATYARLWLALVAKQLGRDVQQVLQAASALGGSGDASAPLADARSGAGASAPGATAWPQPILETLTGQRSEADARKLAVADPAQSLGQLCELNYFLGEWRLLSGEREAARRLFQQSVDTGVIEFLEYDMANRQLERLKAGGA